MYFVSGWIGHGGTAPEATLAAMRPERLAHTVPACSASGAGFGIAAYGECLVHRADDGLIVVLGGHGPAGEGPALAARVAADYAAGRSCVEGLPGPFALTIVDPARHAALIATDRFGMLPIYYCAGPAGLVFASRLGGVRAHPEVPVHLDPQSIYDYVFYHCIPSPQTIFRGIAKLRPAEALGWIGGRARQRTYWLPDFVTLPAADAAALERELPERLERAVARHQGGVPNGAFLSGGLDSSSVAGMLKRVQHEADTFTIGFDAQGYDESGYARLAADHFGTRHHEYFVTPRDVVDMLPVIARFYDEPFGNSSAIPAYFCARMAKDAGVARMLAGDGGDELFAGNTRYVEQDVFERYQHLPEFLRGALETGYAILPFLKDWSIPGKGWRYIQQARMGLPDRLQSYNFLQRMDAAAVFERDWLAHVDRQAPWQAWRHRYGEAASGSALQRMLYLDWKFTLADNDLVKVNGMCELAGVDVCYPMLDDGVVDFSTRIAEATMLPGRELRGFYKRAFGSFLPRAIIDKSKHGFGLPFGVWMREDPGLREIVRAALDSLAGRRIFAPAFLEQAVGMHQTGSAAYYGELLWILTVLELWLEGAEIS